MSSSLDVSLDSLIEKGGKGGRGGGRGGKGGRGGERRNSGGRGSGIKVSASFNKDRQQPLKQPQFARNSRIANFNDGAQTKRAEQVTTLRQPFQDDEYRSHGGRKERQQQQPKQQQQQQQSQQQVHVPVNNFSSGGGSKSSIMDRLGNGNSGTTITIQNLNPDIIPSDISELCVNIGEVKSVNMQYDSAGKATGRADVTFAKRSDALSCVQRFNNVELDGTKMDVKLAGETPPSGGAQTTNAPSFAARANPVRESSDGNVRNGLFGTAMVDLGDRGGEKRGANRNKERAYKEPSFTVNLGGNGNTGGNRVPRRDEHDDRGDDAMPQISNSSYPPRVQREDGGGRGQGRGGARKAGRGGGNGANRGGREEGGGKDVDLDSAMDAYMSNK